MNIVPVCEIWLAETPRKGMQRHFLLLWCLELFAFKYKEMHYSRLENGETHQVVLSGFFPCTGSHLR